MSKQTLKLINFLIVTFSSFSVFSAGATDDRQAKGCVSTSEEALTLNEVALCLREAEDQGAVLVRNMGHNTGISLADLIDEGVIVLEDRSSGGEVGSSTPITLTLTDRTSPITITLTERTSLDVEYISGEEIVDLLVERGVLLEDALLDNSEILDRIREVNTSLLLGEGEVLFLK